MPQLNPIALLRASPGSPPGPGGAGGFGRGGGGGATLLMKACASPASSSGHVLADPPEERLQPVGVARREILQDVAEHAGLRARVADAEADPPEVRPQVGVDRADAVVAGGAAAPLHPHLAGGEIEFVVEDDQPVGLELVEVDAPPPPSGRSRS